MEAPVAGFLGQRRRKRRRHGRRRRRRRERACACLVSSALHFIHADAAVRLCCRLTCSTGVAIVTKVHDSAIKRRTVPLATTNNAIVRSNGGSKPANIRWITCGRRVCRFCECIPGNQALVLRKRSQPSVFATGFVILSGCVGTTNVDQSFHKCGSASRKA